MSSSNLKYGIFLDHFNTEFFLIDGDTSKRWLMDLGYGDVCAKYLHSDPHKAEELSAALSVIELYIDDLKREIPEFEDVKPESNVIGSGVVADFAAVEVGDGRKSTEFDQFVLKTSDLEEVFRLLATETLVDRCHNPGMSVEFAPYIVGAMCILVETIRQLGFESITVSTCTSVDEALKNYGVIT